MSDPATDRILAKAAEEVSRRNAVASMEMASRANGISLETRDQLSKLTASLQTQSEVVSSFNRFFGMAMQRITVLEERVTMLEEKLDGSPD